MISTDTLRYLPTGEDIINNLKNPTLVLYELLFLGLTLCQIFIVYRVLLDVAPFPIFITLIQTLQSILLSTLLGELGSELQKLAYFPKVTYSWSLIPQLFVPTIFYATMMAFVNIILNKIGSVSSYPIAVTITVVLHHLARFAVCGEQYLLLRWESIIVMSAAFLVGIFDKNSVGFSLLPYTIGYAVTSAVYRAGYMQKLLHTVDGRGNILQNHQNLISIFLLVPALFLFGEANLIFVLPFDLTKIRTYQVWGCILVCGVLPFVKNIVSNRLIRLSGQGPWRVLEIIAIALVFVIGLMFFRRTPGFFGYIAVLLTIFGRSICAIDVKRNADKVDELFDMGEQDGVTAPSGGLYEQAY